jgi:hypothetical protein
MGTASTVRQLLAGLGLTATLTAGCGGTGDSPGLTNPTPTPPDATADTTPITDTAPVTDIPLDPVRSDNPPWAPDAGLDAAGDATTDAVGDAGDAALDGGPDSISNPPALWDAGDADGKKD